MCQVRQQNNNTQKFYNMMFLHIILVDSSMTCRYMYLKINVHKFPSLKFDTCLYFEHNQVFTIE